ncbi:hypothetical protein HanOQP8_Chr11g0418761 [Helianthus annuus]|nr:hypothetical protein HanLR1_Chr11g0417871 [Helianthus annuus]KAJ0690522.1 hypothetical protein HanOQP8_Chr11g0418761 [Helianthus annuus]
MAENNGKRKAPASKKQKGGTSAAHDSEAMEVELPEWSRGERLSKFKNFQKELYLEKISKVPRNKLGVAERFTMISDFQYYGLVKCFQRLGWEAALTYNNNNKSEVYTDEIVEWMSTLEKKDGKNPPFTTKLIGYVGNKKVALSFEAMDKIVKFDTGAVNPQREYEYLSAEKIFGKGDDWLTMLRELFQVDDIREDMKLYKKDLKPLPKLLTCILNWNVIPRAGDKEKIRNYEIRVLYALITGRPTISFKHLVLLNVWESREDYDRKRIPHIRLLTRVLMDAKAIPAGAKPYKMRQTPFCIDKTDVGDWDFRKGRSRCVLIDMKSGRREIFERDDITEGSDEDDNEEQERLAAEERKLAAEEREKQAKEREEQSQWRIEQARLAAERSSTQTQHHLPTLDAEVILEPPPGSQ